MEKILKDHLAEVIGNPIKSLTALSGGDISTAYLVRTKKANYFIKINRSPHALDMFCKEELGLKAISSAGSIRAPKVHSVNQFSSYAYIIMEYIEPKTPGFNDYACLGLQLAKMHLLQRSEFGWSTNNYIGTLPQSNRTNHSWSQFYTAERLKPQLDLAVSKGCLEMSQIPNVEKMIKVIQENIPEVEPSLLHGDLWSGNYLISKDGSPYLIDPAVYYGHNEVDIAMTQLFGGFGSSFYNAYHEIIPRIDGDEIRTELYQLYYLLVHLNHFGRSYYAPVLRIMNRYFF